MNPSKRVRNLIGQTFGELVVISYAGLDKKKQHALWNCLCNACGRYKVYPMQSLLVGETKSCGCIKKELISQALTKHGMSKRGRKEPTYYIWDSMWQRCTNPNHKSYKDYGGRGIKVCDLWKEYVLFHGWTIVAGYKKGLVIDRIDVNGDYSPNNCRFISWRDSAMNRRNSTGKLIGQTETLQEIAKRHNIKFSTLAWRIYTKGMSVEDAVRIPAKRKKFHLDKY